MSFLKLLIDFFRYPFAIIVRMIEGRCRKMFIWANLTFDDLWWAQCWRKRKLAETLSHWFMISLDTFFFVSSYDPQLPRKNGDSTAHRVLANPEPLRGVVKRNISAFCMGGQSLCVWGDEGTSRPQFDIGVTSLQKLCFWWRFVLDTCSKSCFFSARVAKSESKSESFGVDRFGQNRSLRWS